MTETSQARWKRIHERFDILSQFTEATIDGVCRSLIISGPAGLGKSFEVEKQLESLDSSQYTITKGYTRPTGLLKLFHRHRHEGHLVVFDDSDCIFSDEISLNLLKCVCDTTEDRVVSWLSERVLIDEDDPAGATPIPSQFSFDGAIIFLTNYDFDLEIAKEKKFSPHMQALVSRSHYIDLAMHGKLDYVTRIEQVIEQGLLKSMPKPAQKDVLQFIHDNVDSLRELSLRMALKLGDLRTMRNVSDWKAMARVTCCRNEALLA